MYCFQQTVEIIERHDHRILVIPAGNYCTVSIINNLI